MKLKLGKVRYSRGGSSERLEGLKVAGRGLLRILAMLYLEAAGTNACRARRSSGRRLSYEVLGGSIQLNQMLTC